MRGAGLEFLVLGPFEVRSAGQAVSLGAPRQRAVLADLVLHAGSVVAMDTLIDDLWGAAPPPTAEAVIHNAVSRLRKALGRGVIETRPPGYLLDADRGAIDAERFERLVRDARSLPPAERLAALCDALALWRGPAFADLAYESFLQDEIARLDELRLTALEDRLDAEIALGHQDTVVAEASAVATQHPTRERLCRLRMLALYRAGRQPEALDAYEVLRRSLDELFGLEPGPETRALQRLILTQDPAIAAGREAPRSVGAIRRPVALLLAELLLDEELELEAGAVAFEDARRALAVVVARHAGALSPASGIELIAAFGAEAAHEDDVLRAARSAAELHEMLTGRDVEARLAVGTGRVLVEEGRPLLVGAVLGQTRRALHEADPGQILVTPAAARLGGDALELDANGHLRSVRPGRPRPTARAHPLVGRAAELAGLRLAFERVVETGRAQHAVILGEPGIGKSRLVHAFAEDMPAVVLEAACIPYGEGISFLPLRDLAEQAVTLDDTAPAIGELPSADAALAAARALCEHFTASGPLVVALDDLHWAVPTFLDLVEYVLRAVQGPLLVVSAARPELLDQRPAWAEGATTLEPLAVDDARRLVEALPERASLDEQVATSILEAAEGVPLFLEQLAAHAAESEFGNQRIPPTLDALLASRIDALEPGEREVLARAAVVGRAFSRESIAALTRREELRELDARLSSLQRRRLLQAHAAEHEFVHPLVHDAAYDAIARTTRAEMHETFARWLDSQGEDDALVGTHLERAALDSGPGLERDALARDASARLGRSGLLALEAEDNSAAHSLLERATALLDPTKPARLELECMLAQALKGLGRLEAALARLEHVAAYARAGADRRLELRALVEMVWPRLLDGSLAPPAAAELLDEATARFAHDQDTAGVARCERAYVLLLGDFGNQADRAAEHLARAELAYRQLGLPNSTAIDAIGLGLRGSTPINELIRMCHEAIRAVRDRPRTQADGRRRLALLLGLRGDINEARTTAAIAREEFAALGEELALHVLAAMDFGSIEVFAQNWENAECIFAPALEFQEQWQSESQPPWRAWRAYFLLRLGEIALARGDPKHALKLAQDARGRVVVPDSLVTVWLPRIEARALAATGHPRKALRLANEAVTLTDLTDDLLEQGETRLDLAEVLLHSGATDRARTYVHEGLRLLDRKGATLPAANGRARFAELLTDTGTPSGTPSLT